MDNKAYEPLRDFAKVRTIMNTISIFGALNEKELAVLVRLLHKVTYTEGERIFEEGDEATHIYIIQSGIVKLVINIDTEPLEIAELRNGHCFGETAVIGILPHSATAMSMCDTELLVLTGEALLSLFKTENLLFGKLILNIAREACRRLHKADETILHYVQKQNHTKY